MSTHQQTASINGQIDLPGGESFQILSTNNKVDLEFEFNGQKVHSAKEVGASYYYRPYESGKEFDQVIIKASYGSIDIKVDISDAHSGTSVIDGVVGVIDGAVQTVKEGRAFTARKNSATIGGQYGYVILWNPPASGKRIIADVLHGYSNGAGSLVFYGTTTDFGVVQAVQQNKLLGSAKVSGVELKMDNSATYLKGQVAGVNLYVQKVIADELARVDLKAPVIIEEGFGLVAMADGVGSNVNALFEFIVEDV